MEFTQTTRLDRWLAREIAAKLKYPELSRTRLKNLIQAGFVAQDGQTIRDPSATVKSGQTYIITLPEPAPAKPIPQAIDLNIVYEDKWLLVVDKPAGMVVHPAPGAFEGTLVNALLAYCGSSLSGIGGVKRPGIVHRLDKDTTGLIVVAKTDQAHSSLVHQFASRTIGRSYEALVWGSPVYQNYRIDAPIGRSRRNRKKMAVIFRGGKSAVTNLDVTERYGNKAALIKCKLETGRTHQIRVHTCHIGHPIIGDPVYGRGDKSKNTDSITIEHIKSFGRQALHANSLIFKHPCNGEICRFTSPLPREMKNLIDSLKV